MLAAFVVARNLVARDQQTKHAGHIRRRNPKLGGLRTVNVNINLWLAENKGRVHINRPRLGLERIHQFIRVLAELRHVRSAQHILNIGIALACLDPADLREAHAEVLLRISRKDFLPNVAHHLELVELALVDFRQAHIDAC